MLLFRETEMDLKRLDENAQRKANGDSGKKGWNEPELRSAVLGGNY